MLETNISLSFWKNIFIMENILGISNVYSVGKLSCAV